MEFLSEMETFQVLLQTSELPALSITANSSFSSFMNLSKDKLVPDLSKAIWIYQSLLSVGGNVFKLTSKAVKQWEIQKVGAKVE